MSVLLQTSFGDIVIDLYPQKAPNACLNFIKLCKMKHYNNALLAEVQKNFVANVRTERPTTIWKEVGKDVRYFKDEIDVEMKVNQEGLVATANTGSNLNDSQFFITLTRANITSLAGKHTVFGKVEEGLEVLKKINDTYVDQRNRPQMNIRILHTHVLDDPYEDLKQMRIPSRSPSPTKTDNRLEAVQHLEMLQKCKSQQQILDATMEQKAKKQAMTLQILGDMADSSLKAPENILFICKLNPITQQRDLEVIFSRFGPIKSVEIVRDWKTGQSLQYSFIQFQNISSCEEAYLKMNNVIIDDRRIQVDFSQSVSKLLHRGKAGGLQSKPKYGQHEEKKRQLLPRIYTEGKNTQPTYELIINRPSAKNTLQREEKQIPVIQQEQSEQKGQLDEEEEKSPYEDRRQKKDKKKKRQRSRSIGRHKKHKSRRSRSRSNSYRQRHKSKKSKRRYDSPQR